MLENRPQHRLPLIVTAGGLLLLIAAGAVGLALFQLRADALDEARRDVANLALVLGEQTTRAVQTIDVVLRDVQDEIGALANTAESFQRVAGSDAMHRELHQKIVRLPFVDVFSITDAGGRLVNVSRIPRSLGVDLSDRDFFQHLSRNADANLFISVPTKNKTTGTWTIYLARRISSADGGFLGVVLGGVPLSYFEELYRAFDLPRKESFTLARRDGTVLVRHPVTTPRTGQVIPAGTAWHDVVARGGGQYASPGYFDGVARVVAVQPLREYPLVMNAAVAAAETLATWRRQAVTMGAGALLIFAYAAYLMHLSRRQFMRLNKSKAALRAQNASLLQLSDELAASQAMLEDRTREADTILDTMDQGLMLVDRHGVVVHCNSRARTLLNLPAAFILGQPRFEDVLAYQWNTNKSGHDEGTFEAFASRRSIVDRPDTREICRPDGRVIEVRSTPVPSGGFVRTYTDITVRKGAEAKVYYLAHHDDLTRLPNRTAFRERLSEALAMTRASKLGATLLYLDLDHFKQVNDTRGHDIGDRVLAEAAQRMRACVRTVDTVARIGGDEFAIILPFLGDRVAVAQLAERIVAAISEPFVLDGAASTIGVSIGVAVHPANGETVGELIRHADEALYGAKNAGRNTFCFADTAAHKKAISA